jgi:hypothetical protein
MTFRDMARRYFGWCPHPPFPTSQITPLVKLPSVGKISFLALLLVWGLSSVFQGLKYIILNIPQLIELLSSPNNAGISLQEILVLPFGLSLVILVADYSYTGRVIKRHGIELLATVVIGSLTRIVRPLVDIALWLQGGLSWTRLTFWVSLPQNVASAIIADSYVVILLVLCVYLAKRVLSNRSILSSGIFLLLAANYLWMSFDWLWISLIQPSLDPVANPFFTQVWYVQASVIIEVGANLIFAVFLLRIYFGLRHKDHLEVSAPGYLRGFFLFYAAFSLFYRFVSYSAYRSSAPLDYPLIATAGIIGDLAIALVAVYPPRLMMDDSKEL